MNVIEQEYQSRDTTCYLNSITSAINNALSFASTVML
jgi:hypothetical protein